MSRVGILGYQGCIEPHEAILSALGVDSIRVRTTDELRDVDRLIIPGGESTTMLRFLDRYQMWDSLVTFAESRPVWGICAGAILMAREVVNPSQRSLDLMDIRAHRNFYGSQLDSFSATLSMEKFGVASLRVDFIRAPRLEALSQSSRRSSPVVEAAVDDISVFISQGRHWACSFHVELRDDTALHRAFLKL